MQIHDAHGHTYKVVFGSELLLDGHIVAHVIRTHNSLMLHGFTIPQPMRRRKIGSVLLHALERHYGLKGVTHVTIAQREDFDPAGTAFLQKSDYRVDGKKAEKVLYDRRF